MTIITTRRHPLKFYTALTLGFLFLFAVGSISIFASIDMLQKGQPAPKVYFFMPVLSLVSYLLAFCMIYAYWKNSPEITVDNHHIKVGKQIFYLKDIKDVVLTGKMPFRFIIKYPKEGTAILFNDGTEKILFDDMYANSSELKLFLEQVIVKKKEFKPTLTYEITKDKIGSDSEETFKGNQFTSFRGILLWGFIGFLAFLLIRKWQIPPIELMIVFGTLGTFWFIIHSWLMHYFELKQDYLIVRNHNFIWKAKVYRFSDIKEVVFEKEGIRPNCMRIITNDYRNKLYPGGTLRNQTWLEMKRELESKGVIVRNECIYE